MRSEMSRRAHKRRNRRRNNLQEADMKKNLSVLLLILLLIIPPFAYSAAPLDTVKEHMNKVLEVLRNPDLKGEPGRKVKQEKIRSISEEMFDFTELSKR